MRRFSCVFVAVNLLLFSGLIRGESIRVSNLGFCPSVSITDAILGFQDSICQLHYSYDFAVIEGDEGSLQKALHLVNSRSQDFVAVLFYASWCPFSRNFRPNFSVLSTLYPSIPHFAIEESAVKPSILSKYGVHGFPTIFLLNSTMRVRYHGSRSLNSLVYFYADVTGMGDPRDEVPFDKIESASNLERNENEDTEDNLLSWTRSPKKLLEQETYLALATAFVLLRLMYLLVPYLLELTHCTWRRFTQQHVRVATLWEHPLRYLNTTKQVLSSLVGTRKGSNFQENALNARAWASKSLASAVSATPSASH
ncbi:hypothetical protein RND81_03G185700 [Saponaria officinalis]|uniref:Thioredoxin domain-containing protein n=1 Tax=Saponaria officinalis TaxID=3572 RepID=A0AAW1MA74_SAPOF